MHRRSLWARESDERAAETPDLFLRLRSSFEDPERHGLSLRRELVEMVGEAQETLAEEGPRTRWTCPALVSGASDVQALVAALEGFRVAHAPSEGVVGVWLDPQEIGDERLYVAWLRGLAKAAPGGCRFDLHIIQPPGPVPPVPIPHPHVAMIFDAVDYVPIIGATVKVNGLIAARAGTAGQAAPPHIPMGGVFVKPPTNESQVFMGSATVLADGELIEAMNGIVTVKLERDALGRVVKEQQGEHWVETEYGPTGLRARMTSSLGAEQEIERNEMGDVMGIRAGAFTAGFERDGLGLEVKREVGLSARDERCLPETIWSSWERDELGRPILQRRYTRASLETKRRYRWDVDDRLMGIAQSGPDTVPWESGYSHDTVGNLRAAKYTYDGCNEVELRMPDAVGNLFRTEAQTDREYGPVGQLLASEGPNGVTQYEYDAEGNLAWKLEPNGDEWNYAWDAAGMLVKVVRPDGCVAEFEYDALGRRVSKKLTTRQLRSRVTRWVWDGNNPLHEWVEEKPRLGASTREPETENDDRFYARQGQWPMTLMGRVKPKAEPGTRDAAITWLFEPESFAPIGKMVGDSAYGIVTDHLGAPVAMYDKEGVDVWTADLGTYGQIWNLKGLEEACPFRWPGQYEDGETGLYYNRFRYYDPGMGVYISQDPIGLVGSARLHAYPGDPLQLIDPNELAKSKNGCGTSGNPRLSVDFASKNTVNYSAAFASERDARAFARTKLGKSPLEVEPGKLRSRNGRWQQQGEVGGPSRTRHTRWCTHSS